MKTKKWLTKIDIILFWVKFDLGLTLGFSVLYFSLIFAQGNKDKFSHLVNEGVKMMLVIMSYCISLLALP